MNAHVKRLLAPLALLLLATGLLAATATARSTAAPQNTAKPTLSGQAREGSTLTTTNGTWNNSPTSYTYQWQRCNQDGTGCTTISGATSKTYTLTAADVDKRVRSIVTATNADGSAQAISELSPVVSSTSAPANTAKPTVSGTPKVGEVLTASNGTWSGGVRSYTYQWQRCTAAAVCTNIAGATGKTYTVQSADVGSALRVNVTAHNASGSTGTAASDLTSIVVSATETVTTTTPVPVPVVNHAPSIAFLSAKRVGTKVYARFRVCDDRPGKVAVLERDVKNGLSYRRTFNTYRCATYARNWRLTSYFRKGTIHVALRATDKSGKSSRTVTRAVR